MPEPQGECSELMCVKCSYCDRWMDAKPGRMNTVSHGVCEACFEKEMRRLGADAAPPPAPGL